MSTNTHSETRQASPDNAPIEPDTRSETSAETRLKARSDTAAEIDPFDAHDSAATFDTNAIRLLPNTIGSENKYTGSRTGRSNGSADR